MRQIFEAELQLVGDDLAEMSRLVESAVTKAGRALREADLQLAQEVIESDKAIDNLEAALDERCVHLLAQQAPVATDLRVIVSALRMSASLERMGDLARHVAQVARGRYPNQAIVPGAADIFARMDEAAVHVAQRTTRLLETRDLEVAEKIERDDDLLDELHQETFGALLGEEWTGTVQEAVDITLVGRYYERFGDHAVSIAKRVTFLVTGDFREDHQQ